MIGNTQGAVHVSTSSIPANGMRVVAYYSSWMRGTYPCTAVDYSQMTHIGHAFAWPSADGTLNVPSDYIYPELVEAAHAHGVKIIVSVGGGRSNKGFPLMANNPIARANFVRQLTAFCVHNNYDGVDIDWFAPESAAARTSFTALIQQLRVAFSAVNSNLTLSAAVRPTADSGQWLDLDQVVGSLDWIGVTTYVFTGPWSNHAGHQAPLYGSTADPHGVTYGVDAAVQYYLSRNVPKRKLLLGIPFYGCQFAAANLWAPSTRGIELTYADVQQRISAGWTQMWDDASSVPYLLSPDHTHLVTYEDPRSVQYKCEYAVQHDLGGAIIWAIGQDLYQGQTPLLKVIGPNLLWVTNGATTPNTSKGAESDSSGTSGAVP